jgi:hypothetical protein
MAAKICETCKGDCACCNRVMFPVPPVCTAGWNNQAWRDYIRKYGVEKEPPTIKTSDGTWVKTSNLNEQGEALYHLGE